MQLGNGEVDQTTPQLLDRDMGLWQRALAQAIPH
eukprot:COSAG04_NODE_16844_length_487_cov_0.927835_1_plen_33_part_10